MLERIQKFFDGLELAFKNTLVRLRSEAAGRPLAVNRPPFSGTRILTILLVAVSACLLIAAIGGWRDAEGIRYKASQRTGEMLFANTNWLLHDAYAPHYSDSEIHRVEDEAREEAGHAEMMALVEFVGGLVVFALSLVIFLASRRAAVAC